jgi:tRNA A-37 threonylcarbamoyl transferase component Bud32
MAGEMPATMSEKTESSAASLIGTIIGDYKIIDVIGQGGMGVVYTAEHTQLHHQTACKILRTEVATHPESIERFLQEARFISRIRHVNLIDIFDIGELPDKRLYYVMEKLSGRTLAQVLQDKILSFAEIVSITRQISAGLAAAHSAGLVHRDLKPDNLFLVERPGEPQLVKVMDFGVAKVMDLSTADVKLTRTGYLVGTPQYMSPEQINGVDIDKRTDIYALGVILYEMCTGTKPFRGDTLGQMLIAHLQQIMPPIDPKLRHHDVPADIEWIIRKALAKEPDERYTSVEALSADLHRLSVGDPTEAMGWYKAYKPRELTAIQTLAGTTVNLNFPQALGRQRRTLWLLAPLLPGVLLCGIGGYLWYKHRHPIEPPAKKQSAPRREEIDMLALRAFALTVLQEGLADADVQPRLLAVTALGASRDTRHRGLLEPRLADPDPGVAAQAATALGQIGAHASLKALTKLAQETRDPRIALAAAEALARLGEPAGHKLLEQTALSPAEPRAQLLAALALEDLSDTHEPQKLVDQRLGQATDKEEALLILTRRARRGERAAQQQLTAQLGDASVPPARQLRLAALLTNKVGFQRARGPFLPRPAPGFGRAGLGARR